MDPIYSSTSSSQQSSSSQGSSETSFRKLQETVQSLLKGQDTLLQVCSEQKADLKKLKEKLKTTTQELNKTNEFIKARDDEYQEFRNLVFPFFDKYSWDEVKMSKVSFKMMYLR